MSGIPGWTENEPRLDYEALERYSGLDLLHLAITLGYSRRSLTRWRAQGIPLNRADTAAVRLGAHPAEIWHEQWWEVAS
jgi:lambda repressor-like predicted transcriptional regulator